MDLKQPMKILIPIDWSENAQKAFNCQWSTICLHGYNRGNSLNDDLGLHVYLQYVLKLEQCIDIYAGTEVILRNILSDKSPTLCL